MSTSSTFSLAFASQQIVIYGGFFVLIAGLIGGPLVLIVFLSLKTFRQSSCAFYLTIMSIVNVLVLFAGLLSYIMISGFGISWTNMSVFYCKFRNFYMQLSMLMSLTCMCLAIIDQFLATCSNPRWRQWNNIKMARYMVIGAVIFWLLHGIPYLMYYNHTLPPSTGQSACVITNIVLQNYYNYFQLNLLGVLIPLIIIIIFGVLAYRNVQELAYRTLPLVRRELDKQLTVMVLVEAVCDVVFFTPTSIKGIYSLIVGTPSDPTIVIYLNFFGSLVSIAYYCHFAAPFYIYVCVSKRFRQQLIYVLFTILLNRWRGLRVNNNQIEPQA